MLANTRPYEGLVLTLAVAGILMLAGDGCLWHTVDDQLRVGRAAFADRTRSLVDADRPAAISIAFSHP